MTDLSRLIDDLCAGLEGPDTAALSGFPETLSGDENQQPTDNDGNFRSFHPFRSETEGSEKSVGPVSEKSISISQESRVASSYVEGPERPERPENDGVSPLAEASFLFPVRKREPERPETESGACERPLLDLNRAAPQRSDWWTGELMAEVDRLVPPPGDPLPISPTDVRAGVARELRALADLDRTGPDALRDAIEITAAKVRNSAALAESQAMDGRCHVCRETLDGTKPEVALMQGGASTRLHIHSACHAAHKARRTALVDRIMTAAGYGAAPTTKEIIP